jgi:hypothetical protein
MGRARPPAAAGSPFFCVKTAAFGSVPEAAAASIGAAGAGGLPVVAAFGDPALSQPAMSASETADARQRAAACRFIVFRRSARIDSIVGNQAR